MMEAKINKLKLSTMAQGSMPPIKKMTMRETVMIKVSGDLW